jgi:nitrogen fixation/metabolism regulation signal transduction histidine kinase
MTAFLPFARGHHKDKESHVRGNTVEKKADLRTGRALENRLVIWLLAAALPALAAFGILLWTIHAPPPTWIAFAVVACWIAAVALVARHRLTYTLRTLTNLLESLKEGSYTLRGTHAHRPGVAGEITQHINTLAAQLQTERVASREAGALLGKIVDEVDFAVLTFDELERLTFINPAGERLFGNRRAALLQRPAASLELSTLLRGPAIATVQQRFAGGNGPWEVRRSVFRQAGERRYLLVITDLSRALREEERRAWHQLIRVLGHEINNSLAPIRSTASTLARVLRRDPLPDDWREDVVEGLSIVGKRAESLGRFMRAYTSLAKLPTPRKRRIRLAGMIERIAKFDMRKGIRVEAGPGVTLDADPDLLEQALINLVKNAIEATGAGTVTLGWSVARRSVAIEIRDEGPGLGGTENLFVPFYTTKPQGTGIGLVVARQIAEAHGGSLTLENREDENGAIARLSLPMTDLQEGGR